MKVIIISDIEGITGVENIDAINESTIAYKKACLQLMKDVNAAISGAFEGGADEVLVVDGHGTGRNFLSGKLDPRAKQISAFVMKEMTLDDIDAILSIGCHAKAGTINAFLEHTQSSMRWFEYSVNGVSYGEIGQQAIWGGVYNVPLVMVSGDRAACAEAKSLIEGIAVAQVKEAKERNIAECVNEEEALKLIFNAAADGVKRYKEIKPFRIDLPAEISLTFTRCDFCDEACEIDPTLVRNGRNVIRTLEKITNYKELTYFC